MVASKALGLRASFHIQQGHRYQPTSASAAAQQGFIRTFMLNITSKKWTTQCDGFKVDVPQTRETAAAPLAPPLLYQETLSLFSSSMPPNSARRIRAHI